MGKRAYGGEDLLLAVHFQGEYAQLEVNTRLGLAAVRHAATVGEQPSEDALDEATDAWRYERDLLSADDTQAWLRRRRLRTDEWLDFILRSTLRRQRGAELDRLAKRYRVSASQIEGALYPEAVCSGLLTRVADRLAAEAAIYATETGEARRVLPTKAEVAKLVGTLPAAVRRSGVLGLTAAQTRDRAEDLAIASLVFNRFVVLSAGTAALRHEIDTHALDWTRVDGERVAFTSQEAAREAALLVRQDALPLRRVAALAGVRIERARYMLDEVDQPLRDKLLGVSPGQLVGPVSDDERFVLVSVQRRVEPTLRDKAVRARALEAVIGRTIQREIGRRVRWYERI